MSKLTILQIFPFPKHAKYPKRLADARNISPAFASRFSTASLVRASINTRLRRRAPFNLRLWRASINTLKRFPLLCIMKRLLVLGAGRSSAELISYLINNASAADWRVTVGDLSPEMARKKIGPSHVCDVVLFDMEQTEASNKIIHAADIVISLLPPNLHPFVAARCLEAGKHFVTASYASEEIRAMDKEARSKGLVFLNECGLDPGIDHLSAMRMIDDIRNKGGAITSFESFTGGLIAAETDPDNPWRYKFTWNPGNVVRAGQSTARYLQEGKHKYISYPQLFKRTTAIHVPGRGYYEGYANRDSLRYIDAYGLRGAHNLLRGTLRHTGFCAAWNILAQLGCCDDSIEMHDVAGMTHADFIDAFLPTMPGYHNVREKLALHFGLDIDAAELNMLDWSGFFDAEPIGLEKGSPAVLLEYILNKKWALREGDRDEIIMWHRVKYHLEGKQKEVQACLAVTGTDAAHTAMAKTVGLPLGIATKLIATGKVKARGVVIPVTNDFYGPILPELAAHGIALNEWEVPS